MMSAGIWRTCAAAFLTKRCTVHLAAAVLCRAQGVDKITVIVLSCNPIQLHNWSIKAHSKDETCRDSIIRLSHFIGLLNRVFVQAISSHSFGNGVYFPLFREMDILNRYKGLTRVNEHHHDFNVFRLFLSYDIKMTLNALV